MKNSKTVSKAKEHCVTAADFIRYNREYAGYTLEALSEASGVEISTLSGWERDRHGPTLAAAVAVADVLHISLDEYIGRTIKE